MQRRSENLKAVAAELGEISQLHPASNRLEQLGSKLPEKARRRLIKDKEDYELNE